MTIDTPPQVRRALRLGSVSYLNAKPLVYGLDEADDLRLHLDVPSQLLDGLREQRYDVALLPVIDYQRMPGLRLLTAGGIGADGPAMTVCIFSKVPIERIETLHCDVDSHTSVALARIILAEQYNRRPEFVDFKPPLAASRSDAPTSMLLIGDKVVCEPPRQGYEHRIDLGQAWKTMTGLPFVFAAWMARSEIDLRDLPARLEQAKRRGLAHVDEIVEQYAIPRGWQRAQARAYLTEYLKYDIDTPHLRAIERFHQLASDHGIIPEARPLTVLPPT